MKKGTAGVGYPVATFGLKELLNNLLNDPGRTMLAINDFPPTG